MRRRDFGKSICRSSIEHEYHLQTAGFFLAHKISRSIPGSQNALIEISEVFRLCLEPPQMSNITHNYCFPRQRTVFKRIPASKLTMQTLHAAFRY